MPAFFMGIDVGSNETKGILINEDCEIVGEHVVSHKMDNPHPGYFEHDAERIWWGEFCTVSRQLIESTNIDPSHIACVGLSTLGCDCVAVDSDCIALHPAILYGVDSRSTKEIDFLNTYYGEDATRVFGHPICSSDISPKILWIKNNLPDVYAKAAKFLTGSSYICAKLTDTYTIDKYLAEDFLPLYDLDTDSVDNEGCAPYCRPDQLAQIRHATDIAGTVTAKAAAATGLAEGTPVLVGTGDSGSEAISTGVFRPGDIMVQLGSSCYFVYLSDRPVKEDRLWPGTFVIPDTYSVCGGTNTAGTLTRWFRDTMFSELLRAQEDGGPNAYEALAQRAAAIPAGSDGVMCLPYFAGERSPINDPDARGVFIGLQVAHQREHLYRSAIEGICHSIAQIIGILEADDLPITNIMVVGGGTKNRMWLQTVADVLGRPVRTANVTLGAAYGDALMAALAAGPYETWDDLAEKVHPQNTITPNAINHELYARRQPLFEALYEQTKDTMHELANNNE